MKALVFKASDDKYHKIIEVNSVEDLLKLYHCLVIENDKNTLQIYKGCKYGDFELVITIYDGWMK